MDFGLGPDKDWIETQLTVRRYIASIFGLPPELLEERRGKVDQIQCVLVTIGNTDGKLNPKAWSEFLVDVRVEIEYGAKHIHHEGHSFGDKPWQTCGWVFDILESEIPFLQENLRLSARRHHQDSIAWGVANITMLEAAKPK